MKVKCDLCKKTIKENASFEESVQGGTCKNCLKGTVSVNKVLKKLKKQGGRPDLI